MQCKIDICFSYSTIVAVHACMGVCVRACVGLHGMSQCLHMSSLCDPQILSNAICGQ